MFRKTLWHLKQSDAVPHNQAIPLLGTCPTELGHDCSQQPHSQQLKGANSHVHRRVNKEHNVPPHQP